MKSNSLDCVNILLDAGADVGESSPAGNRIVKAVLYAECPVIQALISHGADVNDARDTSHASPMEWAAAKNRIEAMTCLLENGANVDQPDWEGDTPLTDAVAKRSHAAILWLLGLGANYQVVTYDGWTILHVVAPFGNAETSRVLNGKIQGIDAESMLEIAVLFPSLSTLEAL